MDTNLKTLDNIKDSLKDIHNEIVNDIFYSDNDLFASQEIDNQFIKIINTIKEYESKINEYTSKSYIADNLFEKELLKEFIIKNDG